MPSRFRHWPWAKRSYNEGGRSCGAASPLRRVKGNGNETDLIQDVVANCLELAGTRITVDELAPGHFDAAATEAYICRLYELSPEQVAAARAYVLNNLESILAEHLKIEARMATGNPPEVIEQAKKTHAAFLSFKQWLAQRGTKQRRRGRWLSLRPQSGTTGP